VHSARQFLSSRSIRRQHVWVVAFWLCGGNLCARTRDDRGGAMPFPPMNGGLGSAMETVDFAEIYLESENRRLKDIERLKAEDKELIDSGVVSALDLEAPNNAVVEFNRGSSLLKAQNSKEAIRHMEKAIRDYPKFVSAHIGLGLAYVDQEDPGQAKSEFEAAANLDGKFPGSFVRLGQLHYRGKILAARNRHWRKLLRFVRMTPRSLRPWVRAKRKPSYQLVLETAQRVHALDHKGMANVHYVAAAAAMSPTISKPWSAS